MIILYRIYQLFIMAPVLLVATILAALVTFTACMLGGGRLWGYYPALIWARLFCIMTLVKVDVKGRENIDKNTSYVFIANHQGAYDIFSIYGYLGHNFRWMMKHSLGNIPLVGPACKKAGHIMVDRSSAVALKSTMAAAKRQLNGGMSLVVFPEGARTYDGKMHRFKRGAFSLAAEFHLPMVPITIDGSFEVMPRFKKIPRWGHITLTIHKPIPAIDSTADMNDVMEAGYNAINSALPERYRS
ncbi:MAG: 1-acyl-sn-glycerol-3-phosphate acyltransferase [Muribaculaceae bacterium]|nr:1-acyl-sn-glycerol-3-phosphate acyltransferase [Muribaculaceae bacterium]